MEYVVKLEKYSDQRFKKKNPPQICR